MASPDPLNTPAPHGAWTLYPFLIAMTRGAPAMVDFGKARGAFGVHGEDDGWRLTHLPTGALIGIAPSAEAAMRAAEGIEGVWDWTTVGQPDPVTMEVIDLTLRSYGVTSPKKRPARTPALAVAA